LLLLWSPEAFADLSREYRYLATRSPVAARDQLARIRRAARALLIFPRMGAQVTFEDQPALVFAVPRTEYLLIYQISDDELRIRRVWSGHRGETPFQRDA